MSQPKPSCAFAVVEIVGRGKGTPRLGKVKARRAPLATLAQVRCRRWREGIQKGQVWHRAVGSAGRVLGMRREAHGAEAQCKREHFVQVIGAANCRCTRPGLSALLPSALLYLGLVSWQMLCCKPRPGR